MAGVLSVAAPPWAGIERPAIMGILNATPDSFSDGGERLGPGAAIETGLGMMADGADILDIGGESTRPGATAVQPEEEQARVLPVVAALARAGAVVSIDSRNASTMARALDVGARIVNDVSGLSYDAAALPLVAARRCPVVLMHMRGTPATMAAHAAYRDVAGEVADELGGRVEAAVAAGVARADIMIDPGFGFAKSVEHDVELLQRLPLLLNLGCAVMVGLSRKRTVGALGEERRLKRRGAGSVAAALAALDRGARVVRVHDVAETRQAMRVWSALAGAGVVGARLEPRPRF